MKKKSKSKKLLYLRLIFLIVFISSNTLAWFIFVTRVDNNVNVHVKSWDVTFQSGDHEITNLVDVDIESLYPGMDDYHYEITANNKSEVSATLQYEILYANLLGDEYTTIEGRAQFNETVQPTDLSSQDLEEMFSEDFPFTLTIGLSNSTITQTNGSEKFSIDVVWPFEGESDVEDTKWGIDAATYKKQHPSEPSIKLKIKVEIIQNND